MRQRAGGFWVVLLCLMGFGCLMGCGDGELEGPERSRFEKVNAVDAKVDRGEVNIAGEAGLTGVVMDRWAGPRDRFVRLTELVEIRTLKILAGCRQRGGCVTRYDLGVGRNARVDVEVAQGEVYFLKTGGPLSARVERGRIRGQGLTSPVVDAQVGEGSLHLQFLEAPVNLRLRVDEGEAVVTLPEGRYHCDFDQDAVNFVLDGLTCSGSSERRIRVEATEAAVRFRVEALP